MDSYCVCVIDFDIHKYDMVIISVTPEANADGK